MPTVNTGAQATAGAAGTPFILAGQRVVDMSDVIHLLDPDEAPLTAVTMKLRSQSCINPKFEWLEDEYLPVTDILTTTATTGTGTISPTNVAYFRVGDLVKHLGSGEVMYVTAIGSTTINVTRDVTASVTEGQIEPADILLIIGNANQENSSMRVMKATQKTSQFNYTQIFRNEFGASGTLMASELYGGDALNYETKVQGKMFRIQLERAYLHGRRAELTTAPASTNVMRMTGGVIHKISTNVDTYTQVSMANMEAHMRKAFRYGPRRKMMFASREIVSYISQVAGAKIQTRPTDTSFPLSLTEYVSPHGRLYIVTHNLLDNDEGATSNYNGWALTLDMDSIWHRFLRGRNTMLRTNIQANDTDGRVDGFLAECGLQVIQERNHAVWNSVGGFA